MQNSRFKKQLLQCMVQINVVINLLIQKHTFCTLKLSIMSYEVQIHIDESAKNIKNLDAVFAL